MLNLCSLSVRSLHGDGITVSDGSHKCFFLALKDHCTWRGHLLLQSSFSLPFTARRKPDRVAQLRKRTIILAKLYISNYLFCNSAEERQEAFVSDRTSSHQDIECHWVMTWETLDTWLVQVQDQ